MRSDIPVGLGGREIDLLPGTHTLEFDYHAHNTRSATPLTKIVTVEAGHIYELTATYPGYRKWGVSIDDVTLREQSALLARRSGSDRN